MDDLSKKYPPRGLHFQLNMCTLGSSCPYLCTSTEEPKKFCQCFLDYLKRKELKRKEKSRKEKESSDKRDKEKEALRGFTPIPLVLRTNIGIELPTADEVRLDQQILSDYLLSYGFAERIVMGDGNCQYRALSDQIYKTEDNFGHVKRKAIQQLKKEPQNYIEYISRDDYPTFDAYVDYISGDGRWGDYVTLKAAADAFAVTIYVFSISYRDKVIHIPPSSKSIKDCYLSYWADVHYNSVYYKFD